MTAERIGKIIQQSVGLLLMFTAILAHDAATAVTGAAFFIVGTRK